MEYLKPPFFTRVVFNKLAMLTGMSGSETLIVRGRKTGNEQTIPVIPVEVDGARYLVTPRGETEWVRNARAAGEVALRAKGATTKYSVTEVPVEQRGPIIAAYREKAGKFVESYWKKLPDDAAHPVFRLTPA